MSSEVLGRDIDEVRGKVERMTSERKGKETDGVRGAKEGVVKCYRGVGEWTGVRAGGRWRWSLMREWCGQGEEG